MLLRKGHKILCLWIFLVFWLQRKIQTCRGWTDIKFVFSGYKIIGISWSYLWCRPLFSFYGPALWMTYLVWILSLKKIINSWFVHTKKICFWIHHSATFVCGLFGTASTKEVSEKPAENRDRRLKFNSDMIEYF